MRRTRPAKGKLLSAGRFRACVVFERGSFSCVRLAGGEEAVWLGTGRRRGGEAWVGVRRAVVFPGLAESANLEVIGKIRKSARSRVLDGTHALPITTQNSRSNNLCGNFPRIDAWTRLRRHSCSPGALIGYSGEISELPQARSDEDTAEKFARRGSEPHYPQNRRTLRIWR